MVVLVVAVQEQLVTTTTAQTTMMRAAWRMDFAAFDCLTEVDRLLDDTEVSSSIVAELLVATRGRTHRWPPALMHSTLRSINCRHRRRPTLELPLLQVLVAQLQGIHQLVVITWRFKVHLEEAAAAAEFATHLQLPLQCVQFWSPLAASVAGAD